MVGNEAGAAGAGVAGEALMVRALALTNDLLFGSRIQGDLKAAGHEVELLPSEAMLRARMAQNEAPTADVLVVDLTDDALDGAAVVEALGAEGVIGPIKTLGFYSHVDVAERERAERAGFDLVVPRSRMAREGAVLVSGLAN